MRTLRLLRVLALAAVASAGCDSVSSQKIELWKTTTKGPTKLEEALKSSSVPANLRAEAAVAMGEIGLADKADQVIAGLPSGERLEILKTLVPLYVAGMKQAIPKAREARDGLFSARGHAPPDEQKQIDTVLLPAIERDLRDGRLSGGRHTIDKMLAAVGPAAGPMLVKLLDDPKVTPGPIVDILVKVGDEASREQAGAALARRASAMPEIPDPYWKALGALGGKAAVDFLVKKIEGGGEKHAVPAAQALQQRREPSVLPLALRVAADARASKPLRDEMFGVIEKVGGLEAQRGLLGIIATEREEIVRYRAFEAALEAGKADAVVPALEAFPAKDTYKKADVVDFLVKDVTKIGPPAKPAVLKALVSPSPLARMTAVLALEAPLPTNARQSLGTAADAAAVLKLSGDGATLKGFPPGETVGKEAARVAGVLQKRPGGSGQ